MAASCSPSSGREPPKPKQSNNRKAAEEDARDEENNATKTFKEALQKDKRLRVKKRKAGGHSVANTPGSVGYPLLHGFYANMRPKASL